MLSVKLVLSLLRRRIPIVYDAHNLESEFVRESFAIEQKYSRSVKWIGVAYVDLLERFACKHIADFVTTASSRDQRIMLAKYQLPAEKVEVISSGCDMSAYADDGMRTAARNRLRIPMDVTVVVFHGSYSHPPNREAFDLISSYLAPRLGEINNKVRFIVGGTGSPQFTRDNLISLGSIDNLKEFLSLADIAIAPLRHGAGIKLKVLDYLSAGLPMVVTVKGTQGIDVTDGHDAIVVDDCDEHFVQAVHWLVNNREERVKIGAMARMLADERYDWVKIGIKLNTLYQRIVR
jgi:glycosyltransferase involved in cell wall biosynthesis